MALGIFSWYCVVQFTAIIEMAFCLVASHLTGSDWLQINPLLLLSTGISATVPVQVYYNILYICNVLTISYSLIRANIQYMTTRVQKGQVNKEKLMMTSSNGNIFRVTGPLCGEFTGHRFHYDVIVMLSEILIAIQRSLLN